MPFVSSLASVMSIVLGGIANVTIVPSHCNETVIAVIGMKGSLGWLNPFSGSKSASISKNAKPNNYSSG